MTQMRRCKVAVLVGAAAFVVVGACSSYEPPADSGGVALGTGECAALAVVSNDPKFSATALAVLGFDGHVESPSMLTSASKSAGLSAALGGDVVLPTHPTRAPEIVLLDRSNGGAVVTWIDAAKGRVSGQLAVDTGIPAANPQDYLDVTADKAYVTRYTDNPSPGREPFDRGGGVLVLDTKERRIVGEIDLHPAFSDEPTFAEPHPWRMVQAGGKVYVLCAAYSKGFTKTGDSKIVTIDASNDAIVDVTTLPGTHGCVGLALSPDEATLAVTCWGANGTNQGDLATSELITLHRDAGLSIATRIPASSVGQNPFGFSVAFAANDSLLATTMGSLEDTPPRRDRLIHLSLDGTTHEAVLESGDSTAVAIGDVRCEAACGACFATDAERHAVFRFPVTKSGVGTPAPISLDDGIGGDPRYLGSVAWP
jgi:hypothetical protein